jgi:hypothetical protein
VRGGSGDGAVDDRRRRRPPAPADDAAEHVGDAGAGARDEHREGRGEHLHRGDAAAVGHHVGEAVPARVRRVDRLRPQVQGGLGDQCHRDRREGAAHRAGEPRVGDHHHGRDEAERYEV